jgi:hypothetical protein
MTHREPPGEGDLAAGPFAIWVQTMQRALRGEVEADVPCNGCTACCRSSQFVHIDPDETDTLAHIPVELRFPAPGLPRGHVVLGYDERGHCPMLRHDGCSIYEHRPRACRTYDCRVFAATGVEPDAGKPDIVDRVRRWRFTYPGADDEARQRAVLAARAFLDAHPELARSHPNVRATLALELHELFLHGDVDVDAVRAAIDDARARAGASPERG